MDDRTVNDKLTLLRRHKWAMEELKQKISALEAEIKAEMESRGVDQIVTENYKVTWRSFPSTRLDAKALKEERPEIYARYAVTVESKRFTVT